MAVSLAICRNIRSLPCIRHSPTIRSLSMENTSPNDESEEQIAFGNAYSQRDRGLDLRAFSLRSWAAMRIGEPARPSGPAKVQEPARVEGHSFGPINSGNGVHLSIVGRAMRILS